MAVRVRSRGRRRMPGRITTKTPPAIGLRRKGRSPGSGATARSPKARGGSRVTPAVQPTRLTGVKARSAGSAFSPGKSLKAMKASKASRTSGGASTPGTGPTPATTPKPTAGKSAMAASRTGRPPAHGARRQGKTPGKPAVAGRITVDPVGPSAPVGSVSGSKIKSARAKVKIGRGRGRGY